MRKAGPNGMMLVTRALTWWVQAIVNAGAGEGIGRGEAALANHAEWQYLLEDLIWSYAQITEPIDPKVLAEIEEERLAVLNGEQEKAKKGAGKKGAGKKPVAAKKTAGNEKAAPENAKRKKAPAKR